MQFNFGNLSGIGGLGTGIAAGINAQTDQRLMREEEERKAKAAAAATQQKQQFEMKKMQEEQKLKQQTAQMKIDADANKNMMKRKFDVVTKLTDVATKGTKEEYQATLKNMVQTNQIDDVTAQEINQNLTEVLAVQVPDYAMDTPEVYKRLYLKRQSQGMPTDDASMSKAMITLKNTRATQGLMEGADKLTDAQEESRKKMMERHDTDEKKRLKIENIEGILDSQGGDAFFSGLLAEYKLTGFKFLSEIYKLPPEMGMKIDNTESMKKWFSAFVLNNSEQMKGALSNADMEFLKQSSATITDSPQAMKIALKAMKREMDRVSFIAPYTVALEKGNNPQGFANAWTDLRSAATKMPVVIEVSRKGSDQTQIADWSFFRTKQLEKVKDFGDMNLKQQMEEELKVIKKWNKIAEASKRAEVYNRTQRAKQESLRLKRKDLDTTGGFYNPVY